eukprot:g33862.t1
MCPPGRRGRCAFRVNVSSRPLAAHCQEAGLPEPVGPAPFCGLLGERWGFGLSLRPRREEVDMDMDMAMAVPEARLGAMRFAALLNSISNSLSRDNVESLKFLCRELIRKRPLEAVTSGIQLFQQLEELDLLGPDNTQTLSRLLSEIQRQDLQQQLAAFQQRGQEPQADS